MVFSPENLKIWLNSREIHAFIQTATYPPFTKGTVLLLWIWARFRFDFRFGAWFCFDFFLLFGLGHMMFAQEHCCF